MKAVSMFVALVLIGAGCPLFRTDSTPSGERVGEQPPEIRLMIEGQSIAGVEGSYCYGPLCVDKVGPPALVTEAGIDFQAVPHAVFVFSVDAALAGMTVDLLAPSGQYIKGASSILEQDVQGNYLYDAPGTLSGDYYIAAMAQFEDGGDVVYVFPIRFE